MTNSTLKRKATVAAQDRDSAIRQRQEAEEKLESIIGRIAKATVEGRPELIAEYARTRDTVEALTEAVQLLSTWADDAQIAIAQAAFDKATEASGKTFDARQKHLAEASAHQQEMLRVYNNSHPKSAELPEGKERDSWRASQFAKQAELKVRGGQFQRDHNAAAHAEQQAKAALEQLKESLEVKAAPGA